MAPQVEKAIKEFRSLQHALRLSGYGAEDSEPNRAFVMVIHRAIDGIPVDWETLNWELYSSVLGWRKAARRLTTKAKRVYDAITNHATLADARTLREEM